MMHYYNFNPSKFSFETKHLSRLEKSIYRDLIDDYMSSEKPILADMDRLQRRLSCETEQERNALGTVLDEFFVLKKDKKGTEYYHNQRLDAEIRAYQWNNRNGSGTEAERIGTELGTESERNGTLKGTQAERKERYKQERTNMIKALREGGLTIDNTIKMGDLRALYSQHIAPKKEMTGTEQGAQETEAERIGTEHGMETERKERSKSDVELKLKQELKIESKSELNISFVDFWDLYDKKVDRPKCEKRWNNLTGKDRQAIMIAIPAYKIATPDKQYRKDPATYLNARAWENEIIQPPAQQPVPPRQSASVPPLFGSNKTRAFHQMRDVNNTQTAIEHQEYSHV